jgi:hypothetical protein
MHNFVFANSTFFPSNLTTTTSKENVGENVSMPIGYLCIFVSCVLWGSQYLAVKHFEIGDGMFFQLFVSIGIFSSSFIVDCIQNFPKFYALPILGGFFWTMGNLASVPVIRFLGIGLGSLFWNVASIIIGWAIPRFGLFVRVISYENINVFF